MGDIMDKISLVAVRNSGHLGTSHITLPVGIGPEAHGLELTVLDVDALHTITGGVHAGDRGNHVGVHPNASLPGLQHSWFRIVQAGPGTDAQNRQIACPPVAVGEADGYAALPFLQPGDAAAEGQPHASPSLPALYLFRDCMERSLPEQMRLL